MTKPKKAQIQHYVPQMLLKNFANGVSDEYYIHVFDKKNDRTFGTNIKNIASERNFYSFREGERKFDAEVFFTELENNAADSIRKLIEHRNIKQLSLHDRNWIAVFVAIQSVRSTNFRAIIKNLDEAMSDKIVKMGGDPQNVKNYKPITGEDELKHFTITFAMESAAGFADILLKKDWLLFECSSSDQFYISDHPVAMHNDVHRGPYGNIGLAVPGIQIYMPVARDLTLAFWCSSVMAEVRKATDQALQIGRNALAEVTLFLKPNLDNIAHRARLAKKSMEISSGIISSFESGRPLRVTGERLDFYNSLQVIWSERYVMAARPEFELVKRLIAGSADHRRGRRLTVG